MENDQPIAPSAYWAFRQRHDRFREALTVMIDDARELLRHTDPMTGIANRFAMLPQVQKERDRVARTGRPSCVCMSDIDRFKRVNDTYGHQAGDLILRTVARFMLDNLRRYDQVCRYGGEEFLLLLPDTTPARAKNVLDRLRRGLAHEEVALESGERISVTASFGVAALEPNASIMVAIDHCRSGDVRSEGSRSQPGPGVGRRRLTPATPIPPPQRKNVGNDSLRREERSTPTFAPIDLH